MSAPLATPANLLVILGPTGSGKSHLGLRLAEEFDGEIINCDSVQVYRQLDAGSAKTPIAERRGIPHHLIDVASIDEHFSAGDFQRLAGQAVASIHARGKLPIVVGGTGFYLRALLEGLSAAPQRDAVLRERLQRNRGQATPGVPPAVGRQRPVGRDSNSPQRPAKADSCA